MKHSPHRSLRLPELHSFRRLTLTCLVVAACARAQPSPRPAISAAGTTTTILRETSSTDAGLAARGRGRLGVLVRATDQPTHVLADAQVLIRVSTRDSVWRATDQQGLAYFESLPVGNHEMLVRRIGYGAARAVIPVKPGCRTDVEADVVLQMLGISPAPPPPGRVTITTCQ